MIKMSVRYLRENLTLLYAEISAVRFCLYRDFAPQTFLLNNCVQRQLKEAVMT